MKSVKDKEFDDLFKNQLKNAEFNSGYFEDDWDDLELMLDKTSGKRGVVFWLPVLSSAAAILIFLGWWMFRPAVSPVVKPQQQVAVSKTPSNGNQASKSQQFGTNSTASTLNKAGISQHVAANKTQPIQTNVVKQNIASTALASNSNRRTFSLGNAPQHSVVGQGNHTVQNIDNSLISDNTNLLVNNREQADFSTAEPILLQTFGSKNQVIANVEAKPFVHRPYIPSEDAAKGKEVKGTSSVFVKHPQLALTVIGAPEVNGVGGFSDAKGGTNIGLLFSAGIFNKVTISTGANYAVMPYNTNIANYHTAYTFKTDPSQIEADCRALDIPINIDYQLYNKHQNKFSIGTGLSSYIMLHEDYDYYYSDPAAKGPKSLTVPNHGKYMFGIANIQATYTRQVNSKFGISVQPYLKLPLTNIGYSQAKLQTAGVAVGLSWNINSLTKP